jgi:threonine/homoserine/homoserine lactone efflux protein
MLMEQELDAQFAAYLAFTTLLVVTPGSATAIVVRNVLDGGRSQGMAAAFGAATGNTTYAVLSVFGLAAAFARAPLAFTLLRVTGTAYLTYLGGRSLWTAWRARPSVLPGALEERGTPAPRGASAGQAARSPRSGFLQALLNGLLSPAIATFYLAVVPSFLSGSAVPGVRYTLFAVIHVTMALAYHSTWVLGMHAMRTFWSRPNARRALETLTGVALLALAARVAGIL